MDKNLINEAITNIASTSKSLESFCNDPKNYNSFGSDFIERMSWELHKQANELKEFQALYG